MLPKQGSFRFTFAQRSKERLLLGSMKEGGEWDPLGLDPDANDGSIGGRLRRLGHVAADAWRRLRAFLVSAWEFGRADRRKVVFGAKVGLALTILSLLIFVKGPFRELNRYSVWAILTVVVVFEFSIGEQQGSPALTTTITTATTSAFLRSRMPFQKRHVKGFLPHMEVG